MEVGVNACCDEPRMTPQSVCTDSTKSCVAKKSLPTCDACHRQCFSSELSSCSVLSGRSFFPLLFPHISARAESFSSSDKENSFDEKESFEKFEKEKSEKEEKRKKKKKLRKSINLNGDFKNVNGNSEHMKHVNKFYLQAKDQETYYMNFNPRLDIQSINYV